MACARRRRGDRRALDTSHDGLSVYEASQRLQRCGRNLLARTRRKKPIQLIVRQFENLALVLLGSSLLAYLFGSVTDSVVIASVVVVNTLIGALQELRAAKAIEALPADVRVCFARNLQAVELALTGESVPVDKVPEPVDERSVLADRTSMLFSGTIVAAGSARGVVVATGAMTDHPALPLPDRGSDLPAAGLGSCP